MQVIIPIAGLGSRLRPHTTAKPLVNVVGKPVLAYILDDHKKFNLSEIAKIRR
jgi:glucose-1-phosphate thymidylyltransferase